MAAASETKAEVSSLIDSPVPAVTLDMGFGNPGNINLPERCADKKVILIGLPGAFTPTWSTCQVPGYKKEMMTLSEMGIDEIIIFCVNDAAVMDAWAKDQGIDEKGIISFMGDPRMELTKALGMTMTNPGPCGKLGPGRCKRFSAFVDEGVIKSFNLAEDIGTAAGEDPAGDDHPEVACVEKMIVDLEELI